MITLWLNKKNFVDPSFTINMHLGRFPDSVSLEDLKPGITVDTDDLGDAFGLCQNLDSPDDDSRIVRGNRDRSASVGDILQKSDNTCWFIAPGHGFQPPNPLTPLNLFPLSISIGKLQNQFQGLTCLLSFGSKLFSGPMALPVNFFANTSKI